MYDDRLLLICRLRNSHRWRQAKLWNLKIPKEYSSCYKTKTNNYKFVQVWYRIRIPSLSFQWIFTPRTIFAMMVSGYFNLEALIRHMVNRPLKLWRFLAPCQTMWWYSAQLFFSTFQIVTCTREIIWRWIKLKFSTEYGLKWKNKSPKLKMSKLEEN